MADKTFKLYGVTKPDELREEVRKLFPDAEILEESGYWEVSTHHWNIRNIQALQKLGQPGFMFEDLVDPSKAIEMIEVRWNRAKEPIAGKYPLEVTLTSVNPFKTTLVFENGINHIWNAEQVGEVWELKQTLYADSQLQVVNHTGNFGWVYWEAEEGPTTHLKFIDIQKGD